MSEQKRYTAQEMRAVGLKIDESPTLRLDFNDKSLVVAMLRQAADAEEANAKRIITHFEKEDGK